jgi:hypothetical protein
MMRVTLLLADFAEAVNGKLYIMGGGWSMTGPEPTPSAIAMKIDVPWDEANKKHRLRLELVDADNTPVRVPTPTGDRAVEIESDFEIGRPPGLKPGTPLDMPLAVNVGPLPLKPDTRFVWRISIDGRTDEDWQVSFTTRPASSGGPAVPPTRL